MLAALLLPGDPPQVGRPPSGGRTAPPHPRGRVSSLGARAGRRNGPASISLSFLRKDGLFGKLAGGGVCAEPTGAGCVRAGPAWPPAGRAPGHPPRPAPDRGPSTRWLRAGALPRAGPGPLKPTTARTTRDVIVTPLQQPLSRAVLCSRHPPPPTFSARWAARLPNYRCAD